MNPAARIVSGLKRKLWRKREQPMRSLKKSVVLDFLPILRVRHAIGELLKSNDALISNDAFFL